MSNGGGLKKQWGVDDPANPPSGEQAKEFQAAFQSEISAIGGHLAYTAANAEEAKHNPLEKRRDALYGQFQSTLPQIDPANPDKAKGTIDKVLGDAKALNAETDKFHKEAEKAKSDWDSRQPKYEEAVKQVEELEAWGDPKAPALRGLVDGIRGQVNERKHAQAVKTFDELQPKLEPIYKEYLKQKEAKEKYDPGLAALQPRLEKVGAGAHVKLKPQQDEITTAKNEMEASAQKKDYVTALDQLGKLASKVDAYEKAVEELEKQKKAYEDAWAALQPKLAQAEQCKFKKLEPKQQELTGAKQPIEDLAQKEEYEQALQKVNELSSKADEYQKSVEELEKQKKAYEDAWAALQPKFDKCSQSQFKKLAPLQEELTKLKGEIDAAVQAEDYEKALQMVNDLSTKVDTYLAAVEEAEKKKKEYEDAWAALQPKLAQAEQSTIKKLEPKRQEITGAKQPIEELTKNEEYEQALPKVNELSTKCDEYQKSVEELEKQKKAYEDAWTALQPKFDQCSQSQIKKLAPQREELTKLKGEIDAAVQAEDYEQALAKVNDLATKVDAYLAAVKDLEEKKKQYEEALEKLKPRLADAAQSKNAKLQPMQQEITTLQTDMESAATEEDYEKALAKANELATKLDAFATAVKEIEEKKKQYEAALEKLKPKLEEVAQKTYEKLAPMKQDFDKVKSEMESAAQSEDYDQALAKANDLTTKVDAYLAAVKELEDKKKQYEDAAEKLKAKLEGLPKTDYPKLAPMKQDIDKVKGDMESAAQSGDYEQALAKANDLTTKVDAYATAVKELEEKKKAYEDGFAAIKSKLAEASKSQNPDVAQMQKDMLANQQQMEEAAKNGDYDQANKLLGDLKTKVDTILAAKPKDGGGAGGGGAPAGGGGAAGGAGDGSKPTDDPNKQPESKDGSDTGINEKFSFDLSPKAKEGKLGKYVNGKIGLKLEVSGEISEIGSKNKVKVGTTGWQGGGNLGFKGEIEIVKKQFETTLIGSEFTEWKPTVGYELSLKKVDINVAVAFKIQTPWKWLAAIAGIKLKLVEADWKKLSEDKSPTVLGFEISGGTQFEKVLKREDFGLAPGPYEFKINVKCTVAGMVSPDWPEIFGEVGKKVAEDGAKKVAEEGAKQGAKEVAKQGAKELAKDGGEVAVEGGGTELVAVAIEGGLIIVAIGTIAGTINELAKAGEERQLAGQVGGAKNLFEQGMVKAMRGEEPGGGWEAVGGRAGKNVFEEAKKRAKEKNPNANEMEIRELAINACAPSNKIDAQVKAKVNRVVGEAFWRNWIEGHKGYTDTLGDAETACGIIFAKGPVKIGDPDLEEWRQVSKYPLK